MNIWSRLGISVALVAMFCIGAAELLQPTWFYQEYKWTVCAGFLVAGALVFALGRWINRRSRARYLNAQAQLPPEERDGEPQWEPFLLFNVAYWGLMILVFGCIVVFIVPSYNKREKAKVSARAVKEKPRAPAKAPPPPAVKVAAPVRTIQRVELPPFQLQGVILRERDRSALINGRTYFVGDRVEDGKLIEIQTNAAVLEWRGLKVVLPAPN